MQEELTPQKVMNGMSEKNRMLSKKNEELKELGEQCAILNREYRIARAKKILELKAEKHPATLIVDICKGDEGVAQLKSEAETAKVIYNSCRESIVDIRTSIDTYRSILAWLKAEMERA